jgi:hypothetical protein
VLANDYEERFVRGRRIAAGKQTAHSDRHYTPAELVDMLDLMAHASHRWLFVKAGALRAGRVTSELVEYIENVLALPDNVGDWERVNALIDELGAADDADRMLARLAKQ